MNTLETGIFCVRPAPSESVLAKMTPSSTPSSRKAYLEFSQSEYHLDLQITENHNQARERPCSSNIYLIDNLMDKKTFYLTALILAMKSS